MQSEIWKSVKEVADKLELDIDDSRDYQISNRGNFRILDAEENIHEGHITISESQASVTIGKKQVLFHRLVALLFLENDDPETKTVVIYKDGDHTNNDVDNLMWVSVSERNERRYIRLKSTLNIRCIDEEKIFASLSSASLYYAIPLDLIRNAANNQTLCFGHKFEYYKAVTSKDTVLYLSTRKAKSLSIMLEDINELKSHFSEIKL